MKTAAYSVFLMLMVCAACQGIEPTVLEEQVRVGEVALAMRITGKPASDNVLIAIHGGPGMSSGYMRDLERLAGNKFKVVLYDQRGVGNSSAPESNDSNYDWDAYIEDLEAIRKAVDVEQVHLLGHSWGGVIAMQYALAYPERVRSLILVGSGPPAWRDMLAAQSRMRVHIQKLQSEGVIPAALPRDGEAQLAAVLPAYFSDSSFKLVIEEGTSWEYSEDVNRITMSTVQGYDFREVLANVDAPVLILWGDDDPFGMGMAEATRDALVNTDVRFVLLEQCGHFWQECPEAFYDALRDFLGF